MCNLGLGCVCGLAAERWIVYLSLGPPLRYMIGVSFQLRLNLGYIMPFAPVPTSRLKIKTKPEPPALGLLQARPRRVGFSPPSSCQSFAGQQGPLRRGPESQSTTSPPVPGLPGPNPRNPELLPTPPAGAASSRLRARSGRRALSLGSQPHLNLFSRVREELSKDPLVARIPARPWACSAASPRLWSWKLGRWELRGHFLSVWIQHWRKQEKEREGEKR